MNEKIFDISKQKSKYKTISVEDVNQAKEIAALWFKPQEFFEQVIDSGMCNSIIGGYILLVLDEFEITEKQRCEFFQIISSTLDFYDARKAKECYKSYIISTGFGEIIYN